jgi:glycine cleavage system H protein
MQTISTILFRRTLQLYPIRQIHLTKCIYQERYFTKKHEWIQLLNNNKNSNEVRIGISDYAQRALGDVVYCELPSVGTKFKADETFATLESVKAVSDCYMPIDGEISNVNEKLKTESDLINKSPYENGWLIQAVVDEKVKKELTSTLLNEKQYEAFLETNKEAGDH